MKSLNDFSKEIWKQLNKVINILREKTKEAIFDLSHPKSESYVSLLRSQEFKRYEQLKNSYPLPRSIENRIVKSVILQEFIDYSFDDARSLIKYFNIDEISVDEMRASAASTRKKQWWDEYKRIENFSV